MAATFLLDPEARCGVSSLMIVLEVGEVVRKLRARGEPTNSRQTGHADARMRSVTIAAIATMIITVAIMVIGEEALARGAILRPIALKGDGS